MTTLAAVVRLYLGHPSADGHPNRKALRKAMLDIVSNPHGDQSAFSEAMKRVRELEAEVAELCRVRGGELMTFRNAPRAKVKTNPLPRLFHCKACGKLGETNRHHPLPQSIARSTVTVRLCLSCHGVIHRISNAALATIPVEEQLRYIRSVTAGDLPKAETERGMAYEEYQAFLGRKVSTSKPE